MARTFETIRNAQFATSPVGSTLAFDACVQHGLVSQLKLSFDQEKKVLRDTSYGTGGAFSTHYRLNTIQGELTLKEELFENMKFALRASSTGTSAAGVFNVLAGGVIERRILIKVISELNNDDVDIYEIYRAKFSLTDSIDLISEDFGDIMLKFDVLRNPAATNADDAYMTVTRTRPVAP